MRKVNLLSGNRIRGIADYITKHDELLIFSIATLIEIIFALLLISKYGSLYFSIDTVGHAYNTRNVVDNGMYSGLSALVGTWLPLSEILKIPFIMIGAFYATGFSGAIVNAFMTGGICVFLYKSIQVENKKLAVLVPVIFLSNIYTLFYGAIPLTEQTATFFLIAAFYYFKNYWNSGEVKEYIKCSILLILGSLTRYEIWIVTIFVVAVFVINEVLKNKKIHRLGYAHLPLWGIIIWLFSNYLIHRDAFWWDRNVFSNASIDAALFLYYKGNIYLTLKHAFLMIDATYGIVLYLATISIAFIVISRKIRNIFPLTVFFIPSIVNIVLMYGGLSAGWERYFYSAMPGMVILTVTLLDNVISTISILKQKTSEAHNIYLTKFNRTGVYSIVILIIASIGIFGIASALVPTHSPETNNSYQTSWRPWIYQGLDISNERFLVEVQNEGKVVFRTSGDMDLGFINRSYNDYAELKKNIGTDPVLMPPPMRMLDIRADTFSVSQGISPSQIIDPFDDRDYIKSMMDPWNNTRFVVIPPVNDDYANSFNKWYDGKFYIYNYYYNQTWRSEFLAHYELVLDNGNFKLFKLHDGGEK